ncbi:malonate decarboxylase acyl carrier protein [Polycladomyces abyssicola]|uniref:Malonate decarboxylase acyl carrier protein n=1 Tax=Polycladomyces abyssicola TaxID=1125966 RepID=A0A8D5ZMB4_9BACL|nr:malonate decarboxylase subunit delta [Polycladomyces abyssicola]BCU81480.1 malonate decarboxylase acyl carrier protein [Polycladomyces abyssicola]
METLTFEYRATTPLPRCAHVGVVGSGDLEILFEPSPDQRARVVVRTRFDGYRDLWKAVVDRFFAQHDVAARIEINDFGATPGVVWLRLLQGLEVCRS